MPRCVPLARRTRNPGQAGTWGGWGGTPSEARLLDFWILVRNFYYMFPVNQRNLGGRVLDSQRGDDLSCRRRRGGVSFGQFRTHPFTEERLMKKVRVGSVCVALLGAVALTAAVYSQEKKESAA